jgi:hypothetical protein
MRRSLLLVLVAASLTLPNVAGGQEPLSAQPIDSLAVWGKEAGTKAGRAASLGRAPWGSAAATIALGPLGGLAAFFFLQPSSDLPGSVPNVGPISQDSAYQASYAEAYRTTYRRRFRWAVAQIGANRERSTSRRVLLDRRRIAGIAQTSRDVSRASVQAGRTIVSPAPHTACRRPRAGHILNL